MWSEAIFVGGGRKCAGKFWNCWSRWVGCFLENGDECGSEHTIPWRHQPGSPQLTRSSKPVRTHPVPTITDNPFECQEGASGDSVVSGPCALYTVLNCDTRLVHHAMPSSLSILNHQARTSSRGHWLDCCWFPSISSANLTDIQDGRFPKRRCIGRYGCQHARCSTQGKNASCALLGATET